MRKLDKNPDVTNKAAQNGVFYWQIATDLGIADTTFSRWLRQPLKPEVKEQVLASINRLARRAN